VIHPIRNDAAPNVHRGRATPSSACRDLVRVAPAQPAGKRAGVRARPDTAFLAHLIATAQQAPQTREKRRAEPAAAIRCYTAGSLLACRM
jgi:hypothetical protein